jgi:hypothetical protein
MKDDSERDFVENADQEIQFDTAQIDLTRVKFSKSPNLGIDFQNKIDAWSMMEFTFRHQIQRMQSLKETLATGKKQGKRREKRDLKTLVYSMREKID